MKMNIKLCVLLLVVLFLNPTWVLAIPDQNRVMRLLEGRHWELREGPFERLGEGADEVLREIADNTSMINYIRFRALAALSLFNNKSLGTATFKTKPRGHI